MMAGRKGRERTDRQGGKRVEGERRKSGECGRCWERKYYFFASLGLPLTLLLIYFLLYTVLK